MCDNFDLICASLLFLRQWFFLIISLIDLKLGYFEFDVWKKEWNSFLRTPSSSWVHPFLFGSKPKNIIVYVWEKFSKKTYYIFFQYDWEVTCTFLKGSWHLLETRKVTFSRKFPKGLLAWPVKIRLRSFDYQKHHFINHGCLP